MFCHLASGSYPVGSGAWRAEVCRGSGDIQGCRTYLARARRSRSRDIGVVSHARLASLGQRPPSPRGACLAGGRLRSGRFARIDTLRDLDMLLAGAGASPEDRTTLEPLLRWWDDVVEPGLGRALDRRSDAVQDSKQRELAERAEAEAEAVRTVLSELQSQITADLDALTRERTEQLTLFSDPEREQSQRDLDALRRRLEEIPDEIEREVAAVHRRFTDPEVHIFPATVTVLIPESDR